MFNQITSIHDLNIKKMSDIVDFLEFSNFDDSIQSAEILVHIKI